MAACRTAVHGIGGNIISIKSLILIKIHDLILPNIHKPAYHFGMFNQLQWRHNDHDANWKWFGTLLQVQYGLSPVYTQALGMENWLSKHYSHQIAS